MARERRKLGEILKSYKLVSDQQLAEALKVAQGQRKRIGEVLVELDYVSEKDVTRALAAQFKMEYIDLDEPDAMKNRDLSLLPSDVMEKYLVLPLEESNGRLKVLIHDPMDLETLDTLRFRLNREIDTVLGSRTQIKDFIERNTNTTKESIDKAVQELSVDMSVDMSMDKSAGSMDASVDRGKSMDIKGLTIDRSQSMDGSIDMAVKGVAHQAQAAPIVRLVNQIITDAVNARASDIHIEPFEDRVRLRYRIDGRCHEKDPIPKRVQSAITARLKIMGGMKIQEKRVPQDGRIKLRVDQEVIDFRASCCPVYWGESVVLRILRPDSARIGLPNLGMRDDTLESFNKVIKRPNGIFLVTGPTGSGKTTTLYTALDVLNRPDKKIITAEDPVEYNFAGINQCQVREDIGLSFQIILRAMLRQAPNIVLVGEIRDKEVGDVAIQAALTGHLVFSTLHTNDAPSAITRLTDMGIKPFLVASSIQAVLAQRLVRILCPKCKEPDTSPDSKLMRLCGVTHADLENKTLYRAVGCSACNGVGYRGRRGIYELMHMNAEIRELAFKRATVSKLRAAAKASGMRNLLGDGRLKALDGHTTLEEVARLAQAEGIVEMEEVEEATGV